MAASAHSKGLLAALVTALVLGAVSLASDETFYYVHLQDYVEALSPASPSPPDARDKLPWISYDEALERMAGPYTCSPFSST